MKCMTTVYALLYYNHMLEFILLMVHLTCKVNHRDVSFLALRPLNELSVL